MKGSIRIGTRGSKLALYQAYRVKELLEASHPEKSFEIVIVKTKGDKILDVALSKIGDKGLFTKELEVAMFNNEIDMAVHSLKDLPTVFPEGTKLGAVLERGTVNDALVSNGNRKLSELTSNDTIATSSLRRKAQLLKLNPELNIVEIRGNVNTRIRKMQEGYCDAMIMAATGLQRLEMDAHISEVIDSETMIPACGQGAIAIEIKESDTEIEELLKTINHEETMVTSSAERAFLNALEGGCQIPVGCTCKLMGDEVKITGFISSIDGSNFLKDTVSGPAEAANKMAVDLAKQLFSNGGKEILDSIRAENLLPGQKESALANRTIISTQADDDSNTLPVLLKSEGADVVLLPCIKVERSALTTAEDAELKNLEQYQWIVFTSKNGVKHFFRQMIDAVGNTALPGTLNIAAIGKKTALELEYYGYAPRLTGSKNDSEDLLQEIYEKHSPEGQHFLLALGNLADNKLEERLSENNKVTRINVYNTTAPEHADAEILNKIETNAYDLLVFASPSAFHNFRGFYADRALAELKIASIGETTSKAIKEAGLEPRVTAQVSNAEGLCKAICDHYKK